MFQWWGTLTHTPIDVVGVDDVGAVDRVESWVCSEWTAVNGVA